MSEHLKLGKLIKDEQQRDAVHIAVAPVVAGHLLKPGQHVGVDEKGQAVDDDEVPYAGVVDPYLKAKNVQKGERFWLFLYPGSITSLRHDWTHPQLPSEAPPAPAVDEKAVSEKWLRELCDRHHEGDYDDDGNLRSSINFHKLIGVMSEPCDGEWGDGYTQSGSDSLRDEMGSEENRALFWHHLEVFTGQKFDQNHRDKHYFSCSC